MKLIRSETYYERQFTYRLKMGVYSNFNVTVKLDRVVTPTHLSHALRHMIRKRPNLALTADDNDQVMLLDEIQFNDVCVFEEESEFNEQTLERLNEIRFDTNLPTWRIVVWQSPQTSTQWISCVFEHTFYDGMLGSFFAEDLVEALTGVHEPKKTPLDFCDVVYSSDEPYEVNDEPVKLTRLISHAGYPKDPSSPSLKRLASYAPITPTPRPQIYGPTLEVCDLYSSGGWWWTIKHLLLEILPSFFKKHYIKWTEGIDLFAHPKYTNLPAKFGSHTNYRIINIKPAELLTRLRNNSMTLTPYLAAVVTRCFQQVIVPHIKPDAQKYSVNCSLVVNGRRFYPEKADELRYNLCMSAIDVILPPPPIHETENQIISADTIDISHQLAVGLHLREPFGLISLWRFILPSAYFNGLCGSHCRSTTEVSNLGLCDFSTPKFKVKDMWFSQDIGLSCHAGFSVISTPEGGMNLVMGILDEYLPYVDDYVKAVDLHLHK